TCTFYIEPADGYKARVKHFRHSITLYSSVDASIAAATARIFGGRGTRMAMVEPVVYGAGAIGSLLGARLHEAGVAVQLIGRENQVNAIRTNGLLVKGLDGSHVVQLP